jgi:glycerol-3-phosphate O-acyltransferase
MVAFAAFEILAKRNKRLDFFSLLRLPDEDLIIAYADFKKTCKLLVGKIFEKVDAGKMTVADHMNDPIDELIAHGLLNVGMYHAKRPLIKNAAGQITTMDMNLLYFYRNRLDGYGLEKYI